MMNPINVTKTKAVNFAIESNSLKGAVEKVDNEYKLGSILLNAFDKDPNHVSQIDADTGEQTTFEEMKDCSIRCALWLKKLGIGPHDIVVVCTHNHLNSYVPVFATFFVDGIFTAWNHNITVYTARRYIKQFMPKVIFTCEKSADVLLEASNLENISVQLVVFGKHPRLPTLIDIMNEQTVEEINDFNVVNIKSAEEIATIALSSGSTGPPKGVMKSGKSLLSSLLKRNSLEKTGLRLLWHATLDWVDRALLPSYLVRCVATRKVAQNYDLESLKIIIVGGSKHHKNPFDALKRNFPTAFIIHAYGATEIGIVSFLTPACEHINSVGFVANNVEVKFVDLDSGRSLGPNKHGEIYVKSPSAAMGYYNDPEATNQTFEEDGWCHTGDLGYYNESGEIFIVDRIKEMIKYRSHAISPTEIEELLLSHSEIEEAIVVGLPHEIDVTEDELMELTSVLEDYKKLRGGIYFIDNFSYTSSGKIARNEMKQIAENLLGIKNIP